MSFIKWHTKTKSVLSLSAVVQLMLPMYSYFLLWIWLQVFHPFLFLFSCILTFLQLWFMEFTANNWIHYWVFFLITISSISDIREKHLEPKNRHATVFEIRKSFIFLQIFFRDKNQIHPFFKKIRTSLPKVFICSIFFCFIVKTGNGRNRISSSVK